MVGEEGFRLNELLDCVPGGCYSFVFGIIIVIVVIVVIEFGLNGIEEIGDFDIEVNIPRDGFIITTEMETVFYE